MSILSEHSALDYCSLLLFLILPALRVVFFVFGFASFCLIGFPFEFDVF